jgi:ribonucleotide reductase alpha subunit
MISIADTHPDLLEFIDIKTVDASITKANISIRVSDDFMEAVEKGKKWLLQWKGEDGNKIEKIVDARKVFSKNAQNNWDWAEAGMLFWDRIKDWHLQSEHPDHEFAGVNPCLSGDTLIQTVEGEFPIKELVGQNPLVYTMKDNGSLTIGRVSKVWLTRKEATLVKVVTGKGEITCTPDHKIFTTTRGWVEAQNLVKGDKVKGLNRQTTGHRHCSVGLSGEVYEKEHRFIAKHFYDIESQDVHHLNDDGFDNRLSNLEVLSHSEHSVRSNTGRIIEVIRDAKGMFQTKAEKTKRINKTLGKQVGKNWNVVEVVELEHTEDVYDMTVPFTHNFIANGMVVHNCAEEPLMAGGSCLLGSLNLSEFVTHPFTDKATFDTDKFVDAVMVAVEGLNEVLDEGLALHPLQNQRDNARDWRQIGLGIMGLADLFIKMGIRYGSPESLNLSKRIGHILLNTALLKSSQMAQEQGTFPKYNKVATFKSKFLLANLSPAVGGSIVNYGLRNSQILTIAPTGSISTMWGISGGLEPMFATHYDRKTESLHGSDVTYRVNAPIITQYLHATGLKEVPKDLVVTSHNLDWVERVKMQGVWQHFIDASISSTINLPKETTVETVEKLFKFAHKKGLKGVTIFRDGCKRTGILTLDQDTFEDDLEKPLVCSECGEPIEVFSGGCTVCMNCGHSPC